MSKNERLRSLVEAASIDYEADIFLYSAGIDDIGYGKLLVAFAQLGSNVAKNAVLILVTNGGQANSAYQIASFLQAQYGSFSLYCPSRCKSAGTLVALGANELIMDYRSELGPLDVQMMKQNELFARKSGLLSRSAFDALGDVAFQLYEKLMLNISFKSGGRISFAIASQLSATMASSMLAPVFAQINPDVVGGENRDLSIATEYGERLAYRSNSATVDSVHALVNNYPSHDFIIDEIEARTLFNCVVQPKESLLNLVGELSEFAYDESPTEIVVALSGMLVIGDDDENDRNFESAHSPEDLGGQPDPEQHSDRPSNPEAAGAARSDGKVRAANDVLKEAGEDGESDIGIASLSVK